MQLLKTRSICHLALTVAQLRGSGSRSRVEAAVKLLGVAVIWLSLSGAEAPLPRWASCLAVGWRPQCLAGCWLEALIPHHENQYMGCLGGPHNTVANFPNYRPVQGREQEHPAMFLWPGLRSHKLSPQADSRFLRNGLLSPTLTQGRERS